jgi:tryptophan synthase alpha chain
VVRYGLDALALDAAACGIDGCLLTMPAWKKPASTWTPCTARPRHGFLAAPTSTERRLKLVAQYSTGFVYLVSRTGVTGERESLSAAVAPLVAAMRAVTDLPLAVGFGVSRPEHVAELGRQVEAVVVGSAIVADRAQRGQRVARNPAGIFRPRELKHGFAGRGGA